MWFMMNNIENIFAHIPSFIFWKDIQACFLGCNLHAARSAGLNAPSEIQGKTDFDLPWADYAELYREGDQEVLDGVPMRNVVQPSSKSNGDLIIVLVNKVPLFNKNNQMIGTIGSCIEITNQTHCGKFDNTKKNIPITKKQADCLLYLAKGMSAKQIADKMEVSVRTTEYHINLLKEKLKFRNKSTLIKKAFELDFIKIRLFSN